MIIIRVMIRVMMKRRRKRIVMNQGWWKSLYPVGFVCCTGDVVTFYHGFHHSGDIVGSFSKRCGVEG